MTIKKSYGFTLIELMIVLGVVGIFFSTAAPALNSLVEKNKIRSAISDVASLLKTARYEAVSSGSSTVFCASTDGASCDSGSNWENGWIILNQETNEVLHAGTGFGSSITVRSLAGTFSNNRIEFHSNGTASSPGTVRVCSNNETERLAAINVNLVGHLHVSTNDYQGNSIASCTS